MLKITKALQDGPVKEKLEWNQKLNESEKFTLLDFLGYKKELRKNLEIEELYQCLYQELTLQEIA